MQEFEQTELSGGFETAELVDEVNISEAEQEAEADASEAAVEEAEASAPETAADEAKADASEAADKEEADTEKNPMSQLEEANAKQLAQIKVWLFQENIRIQAEKQTLSQQTEAFEREKRIVKEQMKEEGRRIEVRRKQFEQEKKLFEEKWKLLKRGFDELDQDRRALRRMEQRLEEERRQLDKRAIHGSRTVDNGVTVFFKGVDDALSLKKRYKDLLKIFHPDNVAGDKDTAVSIKKEYDDLKSKLGE